MIIEAAAGNVIGSPRISHPIRMLIIEMPVIMTPDVARDVCWLPNPYRINGGAAIHPAPINSADDRFLVVGIR